MTTANRFFSFIAGVLLTQTALAQQTKNVPIGSFTKLTLQGNLRVEMTQGDKAQLQLSGDDEALDEVTVSSSGGELTIKTKNYDQLFEKDNGRRKRIKVSLTYTSLSHLQTGRGALVHGSSVLMADDLEVEAHSGSQVDLDVKATSLRLEVGEGAVATVAGVTTVQKTSVSTGGQLNAENLESEIVNIKTTTGGNAQVSASKSIDASAGTGGNIRYKGRPTKRDINTSLGGNVNQL